VALKLERGVHLSCFLVVVVVVALEIMKHDLVFEVKDYVVL
jgi:hypothetical protein